jgi:hypothetical protein
MSASSLSSADNSGVIDITVLPVAVSEMSLPVKNHSDSLRGKKPH